MFKFQYLIIFFSALMRTTQTIIVKLNSGFTAVLKNTRPKVAELYSLFMFSFVFIKVEVTFLESIPLSCVLIHNSTNIFAKSHSRFSVPPLQRHNLICGNLIISLQSLLLNPQTQMSNLNDLLCHIYNNAPRIVEFTASFFFSV